MAMLGNMEGADILSEIHPVAAGVYNTAFFVIIPHRKASSREDEYVVNKENFIFNSSPLSNKKPKITYRGMITRALLDKQFLTLSGIYKWICDFYPFFSASDDKWKNSIRHNLSLCPEFVKGSKAQSNSGHLWHLDHSLLRSKDYLTKRISPAKVTNGEYIRESQYVRDTDNDSYLDNDFPCDRLPHLTSGLIIAPELQRAAEEFLAGVHRPTAVEGIKEMPGGVCYQDMSCLEEDGSIWLREN